MTSRTNGFKGVWCALVAPVFACLGMGVAIAQTAPGGKSRIYAQKLVEEVIAKHPEVAGLELASMPPHKTRCETIAATEVKEIGGKCDKDEFTAMRINKPFVEKEKENGKEVYDVTIPIHDTTGKVIGTAGIDFKPEPAQQEAKIVDRAERIAKELESKIRTKEKLFEPVA